MTQSAWFHRPPRDAPPLPDEHGDQSAIARGALAGALAGLGSLTLLGLLAVSRGGLAWLGLAAVVGLFFVPLAAGLGAIVALAGPITMWFVATAVGTLAAFPMILLYGNMASASMIGMAVGLLFVVTYIVAHDLLLPPGDRGDSGRSRGQAAESSSRREG